MCTPFRVLLIDNYDSYTYNLHHLVASACGTAPLIVANDAFRSWSELQAALPSFHAIIISPGPGSPDRLDDFGICGEAITASRLPVLGVCLGHQGIALTFGGRVVRGEEPMHGRVSEVRRAEHCASTLLAGLPACFEAVRYHSLVVEEASLPPCLRVTARTLDGAVMAIEHSSQPVCGVQFHPESVSTQHGLQMMANFLRAARERSRASCPPALPLCANGGGSGDAVTAGRAAALLASAPPGVQADSVAARAGDDEEDGAAEVVIAAPRQPSLLVAEVALGSLESAAVFDALFSGAPLTFWLDSSVCAASHAHSDTPAATLPPARGARWSYMGAQQPVQKPMLPAPGPWWVVSPRGPTGWLGRRRGLAWPSRLGLLSKRRYTPSNCDQEHGGPYSSLLRVASGRCRL